MSKVSMRSKVNANEQKEMKFWSVEEFNQFLKSSKGHVHYIVFSLAIYTGMRRGEFEYGDGYENNDLVCCYPNGGYIKPKRITEGMDVLVRKAEVKKIRFHDLRHTHASFLLRIGINPKVAAERLGMTPAMFNERYSHLLPTMQDEAVDKIEAELKKYSEKTLDPVDK